jgi:iron complex outermembrane receptor protein
MLKAALAASAAMVVGLGAGPAWSAAPAAGQPVLEEVVVTAQRREENLQQVPASVTSLSGGAVAQKGVSNTEQLTIAVPGLLWGRSTNFSQPTIRGIGSRNGGGDEPNVATYFDGVYQPDQIGTIFELTNIERIEVLKGPQGTLFGRNATGGAINIITPRPSFTTAGKLQASYGDFDYRKGGVYLTGPILGDKAAGALSAVAYADDGYVDNIYLHTKQGKSSGVVLRPKLLIQPTDKLSLQLNGLYVHALNNVLLSLYSYGGNSSARAVAGRPALNPTGIPIDQIVADQPYATASAFTPKATVTKTMVDAHMDYDLGWAALDAIVAGGSTRATNLSTTEASPLLLAKTQYLSKTNYAVTEWVLTSPTGGRFSWLAGAQGFESHLGGPTTSTIRNTTTGLYTASTSYSPSTTQAAAAFGELTWQAVPQLFLTGGLRYNWERKTLSRQVGALAPVNGEATFENVSPRVVARYQVSPAFDVYASYSEGFKSGIFDATSVKPVAAETVSAFEVGAKADIADRFRLSAAAFHYDYKDLQVSAIVLVNGVQQNLTQNAGKVAIDGLEATAAAFVTRDLTLDASLSLLKTKIRDFPNAVVQIPIGGATGNRTVAADIDGDELVRAPDYTFSLGATYRHPLFNGALTLAANAFFSGPYWVDLANRLKQPAYEVVNASATWRSDHGYYITAFGQNLTDQVYAVGWLVTTFTDATQAAKPRWFGVTLGYDF